MKKVGRPKGKNNKEYVYTLRMDEQTFRRLELYCEKMNLLKSEVMREAIERLIVERSDWMESIFVVQEERESSPLCKVVGVWKNKKDAEIAVMDLVKNNGLYNENSNIALDVGYTESDPNYNKEEYCNYSILCFELK